MRVDARQKLIEYIDEKKVIAIIRGAGVDTCLKVTQALYDGGIRLVEVTFNNANPASFPETEQAITAIKAAFEGRMYVGAGTVTSPELVDRAWKAGAEFIISPDVNPEVIRRTLELGLISIPGGCSPTEIVTAHNLGADYVKLFPAGNFGASYLKAIRAPINHVKLMVVGGIGEENLKSFLDAGAVGAGIGGSLVSKEHIQAGRFDLLTQAAQRVVAIASGEGG